MKNFGSRLKEERERLGLSQAEFAKACGVGKTAQYTYEKGDREPSWTYMDKAQELGADSYYVFTGVRKGADWVYARTYQRMLHTIEMLLGLDEKRLEEISLMLIEEEKKLANTGQADYDRYNTAVMDWLLTSVKPDRCIDIELLARLLTDVETYAASSGANLTAEKKIKAAITLYRSFKASGKIDDQVIKEIIALASS